MDDSPHALSEHEGNCFFYRCLFSLAPYVRWSSLSALGCASSLYWVSFSPSVWLHSSSTFSFPCNLPNHL